MSCVMADACRGERPGLLSDHLHKEVPQETCQYGHTEGLWTNRGEGGGGEGLAKFPGSGTEQWSPGGVAIPACRQGIGAAVGQG